MVVVNNREQEILNKKHEKLMALVTNEPIREEITSVQKQLRVAILHGKEKAELDRLVAWMKSLAEKAVDELLGQLDTVSRRYRGENIERISATAILKFLRIPS